MLEEWEIREQEMIAEERDYVMFHRIVNGMIARRGATTPCSTSRRYHSETEKSIANILRTRYKKVDSDKPTNDSNMIDSDKPTRDANMIAASDGPAEENIENERDQPPETIFIMDM